MSHKTSKYYGRLNIEVDLNRRTKREIKRRFPFASYLKDKSKSKYRPKVCLTLFVYDENGKKVKKIQSSYKAPEKMIIEERFELTPDGVVNYIEYAGDNAITLEEVIDEAIKSFYEE